MQRTSRQARRPRLPLTLLAALGCAHAEPPPGAPPDFDPPVVISVTPDSGAVVPDFDDDVEIQFDEIISEMGGGRGGGGGARRGSAGGLGSYILLSPVEGEVRVRWRRSRITVRPNDGWERNRIYRLELLPGLQDLQNNASQDGRVIYFSTGPEFQDTRLQGVAIDWGRRTFFRDALISVRPAGDSAGYLVRADSSGTFSLTQIPPGDYVVYGIGDQNRNRRLDAREASDSVAATLVVSDTASVELWMFPHDTNPPRAITAAIVDSLATSVETTHFLDPGQPLSSDMVRLLLLPDSTPLSVAGLWRTEAYDSIQVARRPAPTPPDSAQADSAAISDTVPSPDTQAAARDTTGQQREPAIFGTRPPLSASVVVEAEAPWAPDARYVIEILGLRSAAGYTVDTLRVVFIAPPAPAPPPSDSTAAPSDTAAVRSDSGQ